MTQSESVNPLYEEKPNVFIVGAPKAGTTSLHTYLRKHPLVWVSVPKETYYFEDGRNRFSTEDEFLDLWRNVNLPVRVEATPTYLRSENACHRIHDFNPDAKILIMLREPAELLHSLHNQYRLCVFEPIVSFRDALEAEEDRRQGHRIPETMSNNPSKLFYSTYVSFSNQIRMYQDQFGSNNVHVTLLEDLAAQPHRTYQDILDFLNLPSHKPSYKKHNISRTIKYPRLHNLLFHTKNPFKPVMQRILPYRLYRDLSVRLFELTTTPGKKSLDSSLKAKLQSQLKPEVELTTDLVDHDLIKKWEYDSVEAGKEGPLYRKEQ